MNTIYLFYRRYFAILVLLTCCTGAFSQSVLHSDADKRLKSVNDSTTLAAHKDGFRLKDGANESVEYSYDANGNLTRDLNKNITEIQYNVLNLPSRVTFADGNRIEYMYDASGTKLRTVHYINGVARTTDYCGNAIYENGELKMLLNEVGYYSFQDKKYHYYLKDHQGNVRVVADEDGNVEETNDYYPFGGLMASSSGSVQPYKYNGKELDGSNGLDWYDYGARHYDPALGRWHTMDPMCEKYYSVSPYTYCVNNPMKYIDPDGRAPGDPFRTIQAAAKDWGFYYNGASVLRGKEFASTIYRTTIGGKMVYTYSDANIGETDKAMRSQAPNGEAPDAIIHSHGKYEQGYLNNEFSNKDKWNSYNLKVDGYVATPDGSLKKYDPNTAKTTVVSTELPSDPKDPDRKNKNDPTDLPIKKKREQATVEQEKKIELKVPESQKTNYHWVF